MATQNNNNFAYGLNSPLVAIQQEPIIAQRNPTTNDTAEFGTLWVNQTTNACYILTNRQEWVLTSEPASGVAYIVTNDSNENPAILLGTDGGTNETIQILNLQGTSASSILINSVNGGTQIGSTNGNVTIYSTNGNSQFGSTNGNVIIGSVHSTSTTAVAIGAGAGGVQISSTNQTLALIANNAAISLTASNGAIELVSNTVNVTGLFTATCNARIGCCTFTDITIVEGGAVTFNINNSFATNSKIIASLSTRNASGNLFQINQLSIVQGTGVFQLIGENAGTDDFETTDTAVISFILVG